MKRKTTYTPGNFELVVKKSKTGKGLFTRSPIPKGACIIEYTGKRISEKQAIADRGKYLFEVGKNTTIDGNIPKNIARYINHSCVPNCEADGPEGKVFIFALKKIPAHTELTYDYGEEYFDKHIKPKGCRCEKHSKEK